MTARSPRAALAVLVALGLFVTLGARGLPLVRNSLVYARASESVIENGYDPRPVVADSHLSYDKPILYAWLSAPFVRVFGNHDGLRITSFAGTLAYLLALLWFARTFGAELSQRGETLLLWLAAFGPCVVYQFWSAHPDGWFAALVVASWTLTHRIVARSEGRTRRVVALGALIYAAILFKNYGLVLLLSCPLYLVWNLRALRRAGSLTPRDGAAALLVFGTIGALVWAAWAGHHPLSRLEGEGGGVGQYGKGELWISARGTWVQVGLALLLQFQLALVFAFTRAAWRRDLVAAHVCFAGVYVAGLMPFPTTFYNMRYFLPLFPLAALVLARGAAAFAPALRHGVLVAHGLLGAALITVFNVEPAYRLAEPKLPALEVNWIGVPLSLLDNLRMKLHCAQADVLRHIDREVPPGATLYLMDVFYYGDAQQGVFEHAGLIRNDIATRYVSSRDFEPEEESFYVWSASRQAPSLERFGAVTDLGGSLYRIRG